MYPNRACQELVRLPGGLLVGCLAFAHTPGHMWLGHYRTARLPVTRTACPLQLLATYDNASVHKEDTAQLQFAVVKPSTVWMQAA